MSDEFDEDVRRHSIAKQIEDSARLAANVRALQTRAIANVIRLRALVQDDPKTSVAFIELAAWLEAQTGPIAVDDE